MTPPRPTLPVYLTTAEAAVYLRADGKNRPCRGPVGLTLRGGSEGCP